MAAKLHFLDELALQWERDDEKFFLDVPFSEDYVQVDTPVGTKHAWQVERHNIIASKNLEPIFETQYRTDKHDKIVPLFNMIGDMFGEGRFAPPELDLGIATLYPEAKLTDLISGVEGNLGHQGWIVSKRLLKILEEFNIGDYKVYQIKVVSKKKPSDDYVYLHYYSFANQYVDYGHSKFYKQTGGSFNYDSRELINIGAYEEIDAKRSAMNEGLKYSDPKWSSISPKELFLKDNPLDLFKFYRLSTIDCFMSARLAKRLSEEKITGFKLSRTTKVRDL